MFEVRPEIIGCEDGHPLVQAKIRPEGLATLVRLSKEGGIPNWTSIGSTSAAYGPPHPIIRFRRTDEEWFRRVLGG